MVDTKINFLHYWLWLLAIIPKLILVVFCYKKLKNIQVIEESVLEKIKKLIRHAWIR